MNSSCEVVDVHPAREKYPPSPRTTAALRERLAQVSSQARGPGLSVLALVAHPDDEAIGPGGTLFELCQEAHSAVFLVVAAAESPERRGESKRAAARLGIPADRVFLFDFPDGALARADPDLGAVFQEFADMIRPSIVITHKEDMHPDHCALFRVVRHVFARGGTTLLHFRIPQPAVSAWKPTVFFRLSPAAATAKVSELFPLYRTECWKDYFDPIVAEGILREGGHCAGSQFAEGYECSQLSLASSNCDCGLALSGGPPANGCPSLNLVEGDISRVVLEVCPYGCGAVVIAGNSSTE